MRLRTLLSLFVILGVTFLVGCGGGSDPSPAATNLSIVTSISRPAAVNPNLVKGNITPALRANGTTLVTGAVVTLTLADGSKISMVDNGNGQYSATITDIQGANGFIIEAHKGDLVIQNLITDISNPTALANITSDSLTTAFAQVALAFAKNDSVLKVATLEDLIKNVTSVKIDLGTLRTNVLDENNTEYSYQRRVLTLALGQANEDATTTPDGTILEQLQGNKLTMTDTTGTVNWNDFKAPIDNGTILPPVLIGTEEEQVKSVVMTFLDGWAKADSGTPATAQELAALTAILDDDFVNNGIKKANLLAFAANPVDESDKQEKFVRFDGAPIIKKLDDTTYLAGVAGNVTLQDLTSTTPSTFIQTVDSFKEGWQYISKSSSTVATYDTFVAGKLNADDFLPVILKKVGTTWKVIGNQSRISEVNCNINFSKSLNPTYPFVNNHVWLRVVDTAAFPVQSVVVKGPSTLFTSGDVDLEKKPTLADSDSWYYWFNDQFSGLRTSTYPNAGWTTNGFVTGQTFTFVVTFTDNFVQNFTYTVPTLPSNLAALDGTVGLTNASAALNLTWAKSPDADFEGYYISVSAMTTNAALVKTNVTSIGDSRIFEKDIRDVNTLSISLPLSGSSDGVNYQLLPNSQVQIDVHARSKRGFQRHYYYHYTIPATAVVP